MKDLFNFNNVSFPVTFLLGASLVIVAGGDIYINQKIHFLNLLSVLLGLFFLAVSILIIRKSDHKFFDKPDLSQFFKKSFQFLCLLAVVIGINLLTYRFNARLDLTAAKQHTISNATKTILKNLKQKIKITAFYVGIPPKYLEDLLQEYSRFASGQLDTQIVDPLLQIGLAAQFGNVIDTKEQKVVVETETGRKDISFKDKPLTEEALTNAILNLTQKAKNIYFLAGHGEYSIENTGDQGLSTVRKHLLKNNFLGKSLFLGKEETVPSVCDVLVIPGPKTILTKSEENAIQSYLTNGGRALFLIEATPMGTSEIPLTESANENNPALNTILNRWGLNVEDDLVVDMENHVGSDVGCPATKNYPPPTDITSGLDYTFYVRPRSVSFLKDTPKSLKTAAIIRTASKENSWAETNRSLFIKYDEGIEKKGHIPIAAAVLAPSKNNKGADTKIVVITDADFITNQFIDHYSNAGMFLSAVRWLAETDYVILGKEKNVQVEFLDLTSVQIRMITVILIAIPIIIGVFGVLVWYKS